MPDLSTLDTVIAMVIVLLMLSLIVQAIQSLIKKLFKLKSRIVLNSLTDLFKYIKDEAVASAETKELVKRVQDEFAKLGRVSFWKNPIVESIEKEDLAKILGKIEPNIEAKADEWFDLVKRSFEERYTRHMKTFAVIISIGVVIYLNADFFRIYQSIAHDDVQRSLIVSKGQAILDAAKEAEKQSSAEAKPAASVATPTPTPAGVSSPRTQRPQVAVASPPPSQPTPSPKTSPTPDEAKEVTDAANQVSGLMSSYEQFGFAPLSRDQIKTWIASVRGETQVRDAKGRILNKENEVIEKNCVELDKDGKPILKDGKAVECQPAWREMTSDEWWASRRADLQTLVGWALMILLLSVGAPFWEDTLSSLFGMKNLLQKKAKTGNGKEKEEAEA